MRTSSVRLKTIVRFLDSKLRIEGYAGDSALNGLQVEGKPSVKKIALAVDACELAIRKTIRTGADLLVVHHGIFRSEAKPITGITATRIGVLLENGVSLYAAHLPLDCHPQFGNNALLADLVGAVERSPFGSYRGTLIGLTGTLRRAISPRGLAGKLKQLLQAPVTSLLFGPPTVRTIGIITGAGAFLAREAAEHGCDALLTGETSHAEYHTARECGIHLICAGHYATETLGIKALAKVLSNEFNVPARFLDIPTGL